MHMEQFLALTLAFFEDMPPSVCTVGQTHTYDLIIFCYT